MVSPVVLSSSTARVCQLRSVSKVHEYVPYAVGAMLAISAIASEPLAIKCNLAFKVS